MGGLLEMSLLIGLILTPSLLATRKAASVFRRLLVLGVVYYFLALFIIPRLPA